MISDSEVGFDVVGNPYGFSNDDLSVHNDSFGSGFGSDSLDYLESDTDWTPRDTNVRAPCHDFVDDRFFRRESSRFAHS